MIRSILAGVLRGVISQRLLPKVGGGRVAAVEVMVNNARIADLIREARPDEIHDAIDEGEFFEMQTFSKARGPDAGAARAPERRGAECRGLAAPPARVVRRLKTSSCSPDRCRGWSWPSSPLRRVSRSAAS